ncbi:uncharacterized protein VP01_1189g2, partial [Puccinia sorghi]
CVKSGNKGVFVIGVLMNLEFFRSETKEYPKHIGEGLLSYLMVFNDFLNDFKSIFFDHNTGTVSAYTQDINQHTHTIGWADTPLMSLYQHSLKEKIQLAAVMSNIEGVRQSRPTPNPNAMELSAFQKAPINRLSNAKHARWVQLNLCFHCSQVGHISHRCLNGGGNQLSWRQPQGQ